MIRSTRSGRAITLDTRALRLAVRSAAALCAAALLLAAAQQAPAVDRALVLSTDYISGYYSRLELAPPYTTATNIALTCADAAVRPQGGQTYIVGRFGCDFVHIVDAVTFATLAQWSTGSGTNPQDVEVVSPTRAYVSLYERSYLLILNPLDGQHVGSIDLSIFADADGLPEAAEMARVGDRLFVCLQRLDRPGGYVPANPSYIAVVDLATDQLVDTDPGTPGTQAIVLTGRNPFSELAVDPVRGKLYVAESGSHAALDGGAEFVDPVDLRAEGFFITEQALGGSLTGIRLWADCTGYAIANDASYRTKLVRFDRCTGQALGTCWQSAGYDLSDVEIDWERAQVLVADRDLMVPGVRIFAAGACQQITSNPIGFGLPPSDLAPVGPPAPTAAPPPVRADGAPRLLPNRPDPFNPTTALRIEGRAAAPVRLEIADVRGRRVRTLWEGTLDGAGGRDVVWDGQDDGGRAMPSGVYFARLQDGSTRTSGNAAASERLTLVR